MVIVFFWYLLLSAASAYVIFKYRTAIEESLSQKALYFLGGAIAYAYNLCFPWMVFFMPSFFRPLLILCHILCNLATVARMLHLDQQRYHLSAWKEKEEAIRYALRLRLEKAGATLFLAISAAMTALFHFTGWLPLY